MKQFIFALISGVILLMTSCSPTITRGERYAKLYQEKPTTIAIMPPINRTTHVDAKNFFYTTLYVPLCERGYYVYSPYLLKDLFEQESAADAEPLLEGDLSKLREVIGADAAAFTIIKDWKRNNLAARIKVKVEYIIRSTHTNEVLFQREGELTVDNSIKDETGTLLGSAVAIVGSFVNNATQDKVVAGSLCSQYILSDLPAGKYSLQFGKDTSVVAQKPYVKVQLESKLKIK